MVNERANCANDLWGGHSGMTEVYLIARRREIWEILRVIDVCGFQLTITAVSNVPQGSLGGPGALEVNEIIQQPYGAVNADPSLLVPVIVSCRFVASTPLPLTAHPI